MSNTMSLSTEAQVTQFATKWNELINGNEKVTADKNRKQSKPTLVLSVIGDSNTFVPNKWPKDVFQAALIETAKSEKETWIVYHGSTDGVSKVVKEAYQDYETMEFRTETKTMSDQKGRIKLISRTTIKGEKSSTDAKKMFKKKKDDPSFLDFETFVSQQTIFYFDPDLEFEIPVPTAIIVCEGDIQTISHISKALENQLPVIIMKGSGKAADLVLDYLDNCGQFVIKKKFRLLFGAKFDEEEYKKMKEHLHYIKQNRELVGVFDLHKDDPLMLSGIVGEAVVSVLSMKNIVPIDLDDLFKKVIKDGSQSGGHMRKVPFESLTLFNGLHLGTRAYVMNPRFSTPTSLPLYFYLGYQVLQENEEFMKNCGKVLLLEALKANRCEYVSSLMDEGVAIESRDLQELYRGQSKEEETLVKLFFKENHANVLNGEMKSLQTVEKACRNFLKYEDIDFEENKSDNGIGDVLLWAIIFNRRELAEICWLRGKDHLFIGLVCAAILKTFSEEARDIEEDVLADALEEHSKIFEQRCTCILDKMSDENTDQAMDLLLERASVWGISTSPLAFAYENSMYNVVAHTCSKKFLNKYMSHDFKTKKFLIYGSPKLRLILNFMYYFIGLVIYSVFVLTSTRTEYYVQGRTDYLEYLVYIWRFGDFLEEVIGCCRCMRNKGRSHLCMKLRVMNYLTLWNGLDWLSHFTLVLALILRHSYQNEGQIYARNMFALSLLFIYLRFLEAFLIMKNTGTTVIMITRMLNDLRKFIYIVMFMVIGVGIYYHANLWPDHQTMWGGGWTNWRIWTIMFHPYWQIFGEVDLETLSGSNQDNCSNNRSIWEADPSTERCPQQDWTVPVIAGLYMMFTNLLLVNIVIASFSNTFVFIHKNSEQIWYFHLYTVMKDYSQWVPSPFNLIYRPLQSMWNRRRTKGTVDFSEKTKKEEYQQTLQKTVALRKHVKLTVIANTVDSQLNASN